MTTSRRQADAGVKAGVGVKTAPSRLGGKAEGAFRTISEVAEELGVLPHVLRFWETRFPQIRPLKRAGGRRYYRPEDVVLLLRIRRALHDEGYTIKGLQRRLQDGRFVEAAVRIDAVPAPPGLVPEPEPVPEPVILATVPKSELKALLAELEAVRAKLAG